MGIVPHSGDAANLILESQCGFVVSPGDVEKLQHIIEQFMDHPNIGEELGRNGRQYAERHFTLEGAASSYERILESTLENKKAARSILVAAQAMKRMIDLVLAALGLILSSPLWLLFSALIKLEDGGPVFYGQKRVGKEGLLFKSWKFRSMVPDSDERFGPLQAADGDMRVTLVGRILRATAMDELPQLWNIFIGDMSFVGPRALLPEEIEVNANGELIPLEKIPGYEARHRVRPGLTGVAQIYAPRDIPRRHKFKLDLLYIKKYSFWLDIRLILLSFWISLRGKWESRQRKF